MFIVPNSGISTNNENRVVNIVSPDEIARFGLSGFSLYANLFDLVCKVEMVKDYIFAIKYALCIIIKGLDVLVDLPTFNQGRQLL